MLRIVPVVLVIFLSLPTALADEKRVNNPRGYETDILAETFGYSAADIDANLDHMYQGCGEPDCIPSIDQPEFLPAADVGFLDEDDLVMVVSMDGDSRAYPTRILDRHEVVNDRFGELPVAVTFCPLCGSGVAFERKSGGEETELGVSGLLHNNDLVLYDRNTRSLWQQVTGQALAGPERGAVMKAVPSTMTLFGAWRENHPQGRVLALPGEPEKYTKDPYADYVNSDRLLFPVKLQDARLHVKQVIYGIELDGQAIALEDSWLKSAGAWERDVGSGNLRVVVDASGGVTAEVNGSAIPVHRMYWFAWYSFHPGTALIFAGNH